VLSKEFYELIEEIEIRDKEGIGGVLK